MMPSEVTEAGGTDYDLLVRYWHEEPWGAWRDNLHTAIIAREVRRGNFKGRHELTPFMLPEWTERKRMEIQKTAKKAVFGALKMVAKKRKKVKQT